MDFDDAKENIQPLATGRNASILQSALNIDLQEEIHKKREALENAILKYDGNDPLEPWFEYVSWIEQSCPSGGAESGFKKVLLKCLEQFETDQRYFQDRRLIRIYIKFIDTEDNPQELYQELFNSGIGTMVADFYICWAYYYDVIGNFKKADIIFRKGIEVRAQPYDELIQAHKNFGFAMSQRMLYQDEQPNVDFLLSLKNRRHALTSLNGSNVGSIRHEAQINTVNSNKFQISLNVTKCNSNKNVPVLEDHQYNFIPTDVESSKSIVRNIIDSTRKQENNREAGTWSKGSSKKKGNVCKESNHGFTILEDDLSINLDNSLQSLDLDNKENYFSKGIKLPPNFVSKNHRQEAWNLKTVLDDVPMRNSIPAYRKNYLYPKLKSEFSIEEYLAYKWFDKRNITNNFHKYCSRFWSNEFSVGIRLYPNFANKNLPNSDNLELINENFSPILMQQNLKLAVNCNKIYPHDKTEFQFEEILFAKWKTCDHKPTNYADNYTLMTNNDMDETLISNNVVINYVMTSNVQSPSVKPSLQSKLVKENFTDSNVVDKICKKNVLEDDSTFSKKTNADIFKQPNSIEKSNIKIKSHKKNCMKSDCNNVDDFIKISDLYSDSENIKNVHETETDTDFLSPNESCSTHEFNLFIKSQSVSTPVNMKNPINVIKQTDENIGKNTLSLRSIPFELPDNEQTIKQLSIILEISESNTATALRKSSIDIHLSNNPFEGKEYSSTHPNAQLIPTDQHICSESLDNKNIPEGGLVIQNLVDNDNHTFCNPAPFESFNVVNPFIKNNTRASLSCNPVNFFEEKTENVCEAIRNPHITGAAIYDEEILDFLSKTPERKCNTLLSRSGDYKKNNTIEFPDLTLPTKNCSIEFPDLSLPTFSTPKNIFQTRKNTDSLLNIEKKLIPLSFHNTSNNCQLKQYTENISSKRNKSDTSTVKNNSMVSIKNKFNGNFDLHICSVLNTDKLQIYIFNKKIIKEKSIINDPNSKLLNEIFVKSPNSNIEKISLFTNFSLEYFWTILRNSELIHFKFLNDLNKIPLSEWFEKLSVRNYRKIEGLTPNPCLPNLVLSPNNTQQKLMCINEQNNIYAALSESSIPSVRNRNQTLQRFSIVAFEERRNKRQSSIYLGNSSRITKFEYNDENNEDESIIQNNNKEEINFDNTIDYNYGQDMEVDVNPFSLDLMEACLQKMDFYSYISQLESCEIIEKIPQLKTGSKICTNNLDIVIINVIGEGAYGRVFCVKDVNTRKLLAMKMEKPANLWEYFICLELRHRLLNNDILCGFMDIQHALIANNGSLLLMELSPFGTLIDVCNKIKSITLKNIDEYVVMMLISQILVIVDHLHASEIIHADIKAENFLLMRKLEYGSETLTIQLIDFGVSIDLKQFVKGQQFTYSHTNIEFQCVEMRENRPWSFQIDLYGVATIIHILLFGKYIEIHKVQGRMWMPKQHMPRYLNKTIWDKIFFELLNIRDSNTMPNLQDLRALLEQEIVEKEKYVKDKILEFNKAINVL